MNYPITVEMIGKFWSHVAKSDSTSCWHWTGPLSSPSNSGQRYGYISFTADGKNKMYRANRFSWVLQNGPIPDGMVVRHTCDVPGCVNPEHLKIGTHADNVADRMKRWRTQQGSDHYKAILTEDQVLDIFDNDTDSNVALGKKYGVHSTTILKIRRAHSWRMLLHANGRINDPRGTPVIQREESK